jgi:hypothetical protein
MLPPFRSIFVIDSEFRVAPGSPPEPVCLVAHEMRSGRTQRWWFGGSDVPGPPPWGEKDALVVAYFAPAEIAVLLQLDWSLPTNVLDLFAEFKVEGNGCYTGGWGLLDAARAFGIQAMESDEKDRLRGLILGASDYGFDDRQAILDYCEQDVQLTCDLLRAMHRRLENPVRLRHALLRGRYMVELARIERRGIPIDQPLLDRLATSRDALRLAMVRRSPAGQQFYTGLNFRGDVFAAWLAARQIRWPRTSNGGLALNREAFAEQADLHPEVQPLRELRSSLASLGSFDLAVGPDGRHRAALRPFASRTGRNQPSSNRFVFGLPGWMRGLVRPEPGRALASIDFEQQEFALAASLSGDPAMLEAYASGDPYLEFGKQAGAIPADGTKQTHRELRDRFKICALAVQYGQSEEGLSRTLKCSRFEGRQLLELHRQTYPRYWAWSDRVELAAELEGQLTASQGWTLHLPTGSVNPRSLRNFPLQANGGEMLRLACIRAAESGVQIIAPVHDALVIEADDGEIDAAVEACRAAMTWASERVAGIAVRSEPTVVRHPERLLDQKNQSRWDRMLHLLEEVQREPTAASARAEANDHVTCCSGCQDDQPKEINNASVARV